MAHTGLYVAPAAGTPPVGMSPTDGRLVMGGIFQVKSQLVAGGGVTTSNTAMQCTVSQSVWSLTDPTNGSAVFFSPTDAITLTFAAAPATGGRIDLVVVKQNNVENGDADSRVNVYIVQGTASGTPVAPAVPAGASTFLQVLINAGVTNLAAATITNYMQTSYAAPVLQAQTLAALNTATGVPGQLAIVTNDGANTNTYLWNSTTNTWQRAGWGPWQNLTLATGITNTNGGIPAQYRLGPGQLEFQGVIDGSSGSGYPLFTLPNPPAGTVLFWASSGSYVQVLSSGVVNSTLSGTKSAISFSGRYPI